ncbi:MAG: hypothetical protein V1809_06905 [Planctomycetota bacterium]
MKQAEYPATVSSRIRKKWKVLIAVLPLLVLCVGVLAKVLDRKLVLSDQVSSASGDARSLDDLLKMSPEQLARVDIARMNLLCAIGLPGAENIDINRFLAMLDDWAARVEFVTARHLYRAHDPRYADHYRHSENYLRAEFVLQVLQEDFGVHYNLERVKNFDFSKSKDLFIHGLVADPNGGTCASMPVIYVAVGRRLGYPFKLVATKAHLFARWDDGQERFNIEGTHGFSSYPDEYYKSWPMNNTEAEIKTNRYLISLSSVEELAGFVADRGHCLLYNGRKKQAIEMYTIAHRLVPQDSSYVFWMKGGREEDGFLDFYSALMGDYRERHRADDVNVINAANMRKWDERLQELLPKPVVPPWALPEMPHPGVNQPYPPLPVPGKAPGR